MERHYQRRASAGSSLVPPARLLPPTEATGPLRREERCGLARVGIEGQSRSEDKPLRRSRAPAQYNSRAYFHSQSLLLVFPSASASYSKRTAIVFKRLSFGVSL